MRAKLSLDEIVIEDVAEIQLWYLRGIPGKLFPTKIAAEVAARERFPDEGPDARYARLGYVVFFKEEV